MALFIETEDGTLVNIEGFRTVSFRTYGEGKETRHTIATRTFDGVFNELRIMAALRDKGMLI